MIRKALATSLLLFMGYEMDSISFRIMFGCLAPYTGLLSRYQNIVISPNTELEDNLKYYLNRYAKTLFNVRVHWQDNSSFSRELHKHWENFITTKIPANS